jgi:predicted component of type VI protein secretion system
MNTIAAAAAALLLVAAAPDSAPAPQGPQPTYADLADLSLAAPVVVHVRLKRAVPLKAEEAGKLPPGRMRFYVAADVLAVISGTQGLPTQVSYLGDLPAPGGKAPKLAKKSEYLILARTVPGKPGELQLISPDAQLAFSLDRANMIRSIMREASAANSAPRITGIRRAFHVPGTVPGESETQIFLDTANARPASLSILRRPGMAPQWAVSLSEVTDDAAAPPARDTLLWYRLACTLPRSIPAQSYADAPDHAQAISADYQVVIQGLGPCARTRS